MKQLMIEHQKSKGRHLLLTSLIFLCVLLIWNLVCFHDKGYTSGFKGQIYNMTLINSIIFPTFTALIASRIIDIEHRGNTWKLLETLQDRRVIYYGKILYGLIYVAAIVLLETIGLILNGLAFSFGDSLDFWAYGLFFLSNLSVCIVLYLLQMLLSILYTNQAVSLCVGICGSMAGLFLLFIPHSLLHKILPWGEFSTIAFVYMDWNRVTRDISYYYHFPSVDIVFFIVGWILLLVIGGYQLYQKADAEEICSNPFFHKKKDATALSTHHQSNPSTKCTINHLPVELMKIKRTPIWIAFLILPIISAIIGTFNYKMNLAILKNGWYDLWSQHSLFFCFFFFAPLIGVYASYLWRLEHTGTNWNLILTLKAPWKIVLDKLLICIAVSTLTILWLVGLYIIGGLSAGLSLTSLPPELTEWVLCGIIGSIGICSTQCFLSLRLRSFSLPIGLALVGSIIGLMFSSKGFYYLLPYSNFCIGMRANNPFRSLPIQSFIMSLLFFSITFYLLSVLYLRRSDVRSSEG